MMRLRVSSEQQLHIENITEVVFNCITNAKVRDLIELTQLLDEAIDIRLPCKEMFAVLEQFIGQVERMSGQEGG